MGSQQQNIDYCRKEGNWKEYGTPFESQQGKRNDLIEMKEAIDEGHSYEDLWKLHFNLMVKYHKAVDQYMNLQRLRHREMPKVYIYWGKTGTGKTRSAFEMAEREYEDSFWVSPGGVWFDGYRGQRVAIFDEFHGGPGQVGFALWKQLCDRYPLTVQVKGAFTNWFPEVIIFTSNVDPKLWWPEERKPVDWYDQFTRRVFENKEFQ